MKGFVHLSLLALGALSASAAPQGSVDEDHDLRYRFYYPGECDHLASPNNTYPALDLPSGKGSFGSCYSAPVGVDWSRLEVRPTDAVKGSFGVQAYCNVECQGEVNQQVHPAPGSHCYLPYNVNYKCAIGSFRAYQL